MKTTTFSTTTISAPVAVHPTPSRITFAGNTYHGSRITTNNNNNNNNMTDSPPPPYKSRSSSSTSISSTSSVSPTTAPLPDLQTLALNLMHTLYNTQDLAHASTLVHPKVTLTHNDSPIAYSREAYLEYWRARTSTNSGSSLRWNCKEAVVDEAQRKVWCVGEVVVNGSGGSTTTSRSSSSSRRKESVDMLSFDEQGRLVGEEDWVRVVRTRDEAD